MAGESQSWDRWPFGDDVRPFSYDLVMIDPPWSFSNWSEKGIHKNAAAKYDCLDLDTIKSLPVGHLGAHSAIYWLWATNPMLDVAFDVLKAWGVKFVTAGTWVKRTKNGKLAFGTGYRLRSANEPFLLATNGDPATARNVRSVIEGPLREHSRKPDESFHEAERLMAATPGARFIELFSRADRPGWDSWGDEVGKFNPADGEAA